MVTRQADVKLTQVLRETMRIVKLVKDVLVVVDEVDRLVVVYRNSVRWLRLVYAKRTKVGIVLGVTLRHRDL